MRYGFGGHLEKPADRFRGLEHLKVFLSKPFVDSVARP
jgi:hypothetical protein